MHFTTPSHQARPTLRRAQAHAALRREAAHRPHVTHRARPARMPRLWHFATEYLLLLPIGAVIALVWVNTAPESYFRVTGVLRFAVNDVAMTLSTASPSLMAMAPVLNPLTISLGPAEQVAAMNMPAAPAARMAMTTSFFMGYLTIRDFGGASR